eukprot:1020245-Karenia_brevis.AAC.1
MGVTKGAPGIAHAPESLAIQSDSQYAWGAAHTMLSRLFGGTIFGLAQGRLKKSLNGPYLGTQSGIFTAHQIIIYITIGMH